jgi:glycosyltransferase involved in cell wall biosynthesis
MTQPKLSIVICTYNREKYILEALESVNRQDYDLSGIELIVIDNNSTDRSALLIQNFIAANGGKPYFYYLETQQGLSYARNTGIAHAKADIITFIDDDAIAREDFVKNTIDFFNKYPQAAAAGGKVIPKFTEGEPEWLSKYVRKVVSEIDFGPHVKELTGRKYPFGANMSFRSEVFRKYGYFHTGLGRTGANLLGGEEKDMFDRMKLGGEHIYYSPDMVVQHIIDPYRLSMEYLERFCKGVGKSERIRLKDKGMLPKFIKWTDNKVKRLGSIVIGNWYISKGLKAQGQMIKDVMRWIEEGYADS